MQCTGSDASARADRASPHEPPWAALPIVSIHILGTGVLVALLLHACGVPEEEIIKDYTLSHEWGCSTEGKWAMRQALPERVRYVMRQEILDEWCEAPEFVLRDLFGKLKKEYGSVNGYLDSIGVDASMRGRIQEQMLTTA